MAGHNLTEPQVKLLLRLYERPQTVGWEFRPLRPLVEQELARPRDVSGPGSKSYLYELTRAGKVLALSILEERASQS